MPRSTLSLFILLISLASFLSGIYIGRGTASRSEVLSLQDTVPSPTHMPSPTITLRPTRTKQRTSDINVQVGKTGSMVTDDSCGIMYQIPPTYIQQTSDMGSIIFSDPKEKQSFVVAVCEQEIPEPPVPKEKKASTTLDGVTGTLYHDKNPDGSERDEIIVTHPILDHEIIIAGWGKGYDLAVSTFSFIQ